MNDLEEESGARALHELCAHVGIATHYHDIWGNYCEVAREDLVALLREFEVRLDEERTPKRAFEAARRTSWSVALPRAAALQASEPEWSLAIRLKASIDELRWRLEEESGALHTGVVHAHSLPEEAREELDIGAWCERRLRFHMRLPVGYHRLSVDGLAGETLLICAPDRCYRPEALQNGGRVWGPAVQLYSLRSPRNWGIGDFTDLTRFIDLMAGRGASIIGINPLHALFPHNPKHTSPYSPSSRRHLNVLYIDVEAAEGFADCEAAVRLVGSPGFQARLAGLREAPLVDHAGVAAAKFEVLELLFADFRERHLASDGKRPLDDVGRDFLSFVAEGGEALHGHALFEALQAHFHATDPSVWGSPAWPEGFRDPAGAAVRDFALENAERVRYYQYLQWVAARQLARASRHGAAQGLGVGLYLDLAVSVDRAGSDAWQERENFTAESSLGAPPDAFNPNGQGWGLPALRPDRLRESHYRLFIETLRANMRDAGALRVDHVMGLMRLFWIPAGKTAREGAYVRYPLDEMLAIVAVESQRNQCLVIGEDLGTVADEVRSALAGYDVLSYRLLYFERGEGGCFKPVSDYPESALVAIGTHDLAPLPGWWAEHDLRLRRELALIQKPGTFETLVLERAQDRDRLIATARNEGLLSAEEAAQARFDETISPKVVEAVHASLARTRSAVMIVHLEDSLGVVDAVNVPGTSEEQPNWRRKMPIDLPRLAENEDVLHLTRTMARLRPRLEPSPPAGLIS